MVLLVYWKEELVTNIVQALCFSVLCCGILAVNEDLDLSNIHEHFQCETS